MTWLKNMKLHSGKKINRKLIKYYLEISYSHSFQASENSSSVIKPRIEFVQTNTGIFECKIKMVLIGRWVNFDNT